MDKVFGIGLSRTGTLSLTVALRELGYRSIHFPADENTQLEFYHFFNTIAKTIHLKALKYYDAITDTPVCCLYKALDISYPNSKFILTVRKKEAWMKSCKRYWEEVLLPALSTDPNSSYTHYIHEVNTNIYGTKIYDPDKFSSVYDVYINEVTTHFRDRKKDFLILDICGGEGWNKLAPFLGTAIPDKEFPFENRLVGIP